MGVMKQAWADNFTPVTAQLMLRLPDGTWVPYIAKPEPLSGISIIERLRSGPFTETGCRHEWKSVPGIYKVYVNCKHCGIGKETLNAENS